LWHGVRTSSHLVCEQGKGEGWTSNKPNTIYILDSRRRGREEVEVTDYYRYMGVYLDSKLN